MTAEKDLATPALIIFEEELLSTLSHLNHIAAEAGCTLLFALKSCSLLPALEVIGPKVGGFSAGSLFEAVLAYHTIQHNGSVHLTTPGLRPDEVEVLSHLCDYISFNPLNQWKRLGHKVSRRLTCRCA